MARARNAKGHFIKGHKGHKASHATKSITRTVSPKVTVVRVGASQPKKVKRHRRRGHGGGIFGGPPSGETLLKLGITGAAIGFLTGDNSPLGSVRTFFTETVPGGKTFGPVATLGATALVVDRFIYKSKWLRIAGMVGVGIAAVKLGQQGTAFKWLGDDGGGGDDYVADVED